MNLVHASRRCSEDVSVLGMAIQDTPSLHPWQEGPLEKIVKPSDGPNLAHKGTVDTICDGQTAVVCDTVLCVRICMLWALWPP